MNIQNPEHNANNITKIQAIFVGLFMSVFSGGLLFLVLRSIGVDGTPLPQELIWLFPIPIGTSIGFYAAKFSLRVSATQEKA